MHDQIVMTESMADTIGKPFWHIHHDTLFEIAAYSIKTRIGWILGNKPDHEIETRLRLLRPIQGEFPKDVLCAYGAAQDARRSSEAAMQATHKPCTEYHYELATLSNEAESYEEKERVYTGSQKNRTALGEAYDLSITKMHAAADTARDVKQAYEEVILIHAAEIEALHDLECPDCPWNGSTIFPNGADTCTTKS